MMKIVILAYDYPPNNGGIARLCSEIKKQMQLHQQNVQVITLFKKQHDLEEDKSVVRVSGRRVILEIKLLLILLRHVSKSDIVITDTYHPSGLLALIAHRKTVILAHGAELLPGKGFFRKRIWSIYRSWILNKAYKVVANSYYTASLVLRCSPKANVEVIPLAVDEKCFHPTMPKKNNNCLNLCSISRLEKHKGHDFIIDTIASLPLMYRNRIKLNIGGKGSYKSFLEDKVDELGLKDVVSFSGFISDKHLCDFYSEADVFILCTREEPELRKVEGFGLVFVEAQSCGTAVIGTRSGGILDAIEENNGGWFVSQDSKEELSALLIELINKPFVLVEEGIKARKRIEKKYTWDRYYNQLIKCICK